MAKIIKISHNSPALHKLKIGDDVISFNDRNFVDVLDYIYADSLETVEITFYRNEQKESVTIVKNQYESLGIDFDSSVEIVPMECYNNCIFCFVQQLPKGLRDTLYVKDDDYRLSFISGSYITCTNLKEEDIQRIIDYKLSPLYVSVHATDEKVRLFLLGIKRTRYKQTELLQRLVTNGITIHAQIVLVGGINDGEVLEKSLSDLFEIGVATVAIVPVGLTGHREGRYHLDTLNSQQACDAIDITENFYKTHPGFCYCSDEMYQIAGRNVPGAEYYGEYEQIENGVGLITKFLDELDFALENAPKKVRKTSVGIITGVSGESTMLKAKQKLTSKYPNVEINIYVVKNNFFGQSVTVTGLVTGKDIVEQYGDRNFKEKVLMIPSVMLKEFEDVFLDGMHLKQLEHRLRKRILVNSGTGSDFLDKIIKGR